MMGLFSNLRGKFSIVGSPHFYYGKSLTRLFAHKIVVLLGFLKSSRGNRSLFKNTSNFRNYGVGKTALVLGTGPSLSNLRLDLVQDYVNDVFVVNEYFSLKISDKLKPDFYCLSDPLHFDPNSAGMSETRNSLQEYFADCNPVLIFPHWAKSLPYFKDFSTLYFDDREQSWFSKNISPLKPRGYTSVTLYKALAMACFMNYDKIYLLGLDNTNFKSYIGSKDNIVLDNSSITAEKNETDKPSIYAAPQIKFTSGIAGRMQSYALLFGDLKFFNKNNIVNLSENSLVDVFIKESNHPLVIQAEEG